MTKRAVTPSFVSVPASVTSTTYCYSASFPRSRDNACASPSNYLALSTHEEPLFFRRGDYWVVRYEGDVAFLKATRGMQCLSVLLHHPGREFHVNELLGLVDGTPVVMSKVAEVPGVGQSPCRAGAILDAQAKSQYKNRLKNLRADLEEAERFCDANRAEQARSEISALAQQLAAAIGLGGRDRRSGSEAERARCAVTKRIKDSINKIGESIPSLRRYLAAQIRTGYFCAYNPDPASSVAWRFLALLALSYATDNYGLT